MSFSYWHAGLIFAYFVCFYTVLFWFFVFCFGVGLFPVSGPGRGSLGLYGVSYKNWLFSTVFGQFLGLVCYYFCTLFGLGVLGVLVLDDIWVFSFGFLFFVCFSLDSIFGVSFGCYLDFLLFLFFLYLWANIWGFYAVWVLLASAYVLCYVICVYGVGSLLVLFGLSICFVCMFIVLFFCLYTELLFVFWLLFVACGCYLGIMGCFGLFLAICFCLFCVVVGWCGLVWVGVGCLFLCCFIFYWVCISCFCCGVICLFCYLGVVVCWVILVLFGFGYCLGFSAVCLFVACYLGWRLYLVWLVLVFWCYSVVAYCFRLFLVYLLSFAVFLVVLAYYCGLILCGYFFLLCLCYF